VGASAIGLRLTGAGEKCTGLSAEGPPPIAITSRIVRAA
jgi:hypothetical protein